MLNNIATLGPQGTFSEIATKQYIGEQQQPLEIIYYNTINQSLNAIGKKAKYGMLPVENFSEGFVNPVLDYLVNADLYICAELLLPIQFSLVSHSKSIKDIKSIYVQFVARGQCAEYLENLTDMRFVTTESNTQALTSIDTDLTSAAVVPSHLLNTSSFATMIENITDYKNNQTRFLLLSSDAQDSKATQFVSVTECYKTSIIVLFHDDYPGYLEGVLRRFTERNIDLTSIVSRPTRKHFGKYHFFIDLDGHVNDPRIKGALNELGQHFKMKILGSYPKKPAF